MECLLFSKNEVECQFSKLRCAESNIAKIRRCQYNLSSYFYHLPTKKISISFSPKSFFFQQIIIKPFFFSFIVSLDEGVVRRVDEREWRGFNKLYLDVFNDGGERIWGDLEGYLTLPNRCVCVCVCIYYVTHLEWR